MNTVIGDLLKVKRGIICHQVNCKYVMGAGLAAQIRKAYPEHYSDYMSRYAHLGGLCITQINSDLYVIGIYGQDSYGRSGGYSTNRVDTPRKGEQGDYVQGVQIPFISHQRAGKGFKFRLYPTKEQAERINKTLGCCRYVYNHMLERRIKAYKRRKRTIGTARVVGT